MPPAGSCGAAARRACSRDWRLPSPRRARAPPTAERAAGERAEAIAESVAACAEASFNELPLPLAQHPD
jgi:hypothetical protein